MKRVTREELVATYVGSICETIFVEDPWFVLAYYLVPVQKAADIPAKKLSWDDVHKTPEYFRRFKSPEGDWLEGRDKTHSPEAGNNNNIKVLVIDIARHVSLDGPKWYAIVLYNERPHCIPLLNLIKVFPLPQEAHD